MVVCPHWQHVQPYPHTGPCGRETEDRDDDAELDPEACVVERRPGLGLELAVVLLGEAMMGERKDLSSCGLG